MTTMIELRVRVVVETESVGLDAIGTAIADALAASDGSAFGDSDYIVKDWAVDYVGNDGASMSGDYAEADKAIGDELRGWAWHYLDAATGESLPGNLLDGCPCKGFRYRHTCKHYEAVAAEYRASMTGAAVIMP